MNGKQHCFPQMLPFTPKIGFAECSRFLCKRKALGKKASNGIDLRPKKGGLSHFHAIPYKQATKMSGGLFMKKNGVEPDPLKTYEKPLGSVRLNREQSFLKVWKFKCESKGGGECADMLCIHCLSSQSQPEWMFAQYRPTISCET